MVLPEEELQVAMYEHCLHRTREAGLDQYEISSFARPGFECRHNLEYWRGEEYAGYGPGAVETMEGVRITNLKQPARYAAAIESGLDPGYDRETLDAGTRRKERIMLGLRLNEGIPEAWSDDPAAVEKLLDRGWLEADNGFLRLTEAGRHFCSEATTLLI